MSTHAQLLKTPLFDEHVRLGAKMVPFGGWDMPVQYAGILDEYAQTRQQASLFDISHMGEFIIQGDLMKSGLDRIVTQRLSDLPVKSCRYGGMLNVDGGVIDDLIVFRLEQDKWFIVVNGATIDKDAQQFKNQLTQDAQFDDVTFHTAKLDLQGPLSREVLKQHVPGVENLAYYTFDFFNFLGENVLISRTGYTGELGYEVYCPWDRALEYWQILMQDERVEPAGLGARDVLRLEVGYGLYGHELNEDISALESGLNRFIDFDKDFIGKAALQGQQDAGVPRKLVGLVSRSRRSPRSEQQIYTEAGEVIGVVTSGSFSPHLERGIGVGLIDQRHAVQGQAVMFGTERSRAEAEISSKIFYKNGSLKS